MKLLYVEARDVNPYQNIALEKYLFERYGHNNIILYLWQNDKTVVIGKHQNPWAECNIQAIKEVGGHVVRRYSGGGAVYHDIGNLNFTFILPKTEYHLEKQLSVILNSLQDLGINALFSGRNDITYRGKKFSGNAFFHSQGASCHHGTLLIGSNLSNVGKYLNPNKLKLRSNGVKSVQSRVINLSSIVPTLTVTKVIDAIKVEFAKVYQGSLETLSLDQLTSDTAYQEIYQKVKSQEWNFGKTPKFEISHEEKFSWGHINLAANVKNGTFEDVKVFTDAIDVDFMTELNNKLKGRSYSFEACSSVLDSIDHNHEYQMDLQNFFQSIFD